MRTVFVAALVLLCASAVAQDAPKAAPLVNPASPAGARVFIESPRDGATVGQDVHVVFGASDIKVAPATDTAPGTGHHHLLIDVKQLPSLDGPIPADANHKHYGKGQTEDTIHLPPGDHTLQLDFADYRHVQFNPPLVSNKITIHVK
ncbi:MAG: DUF4399 domain-containing protein [Proteobacteria bacterium]|nr:DUF4399 domain-containing protein [Pseudomonadota bacterium]